MARPLKKGLDYFPLDVDLFSDLKIRVLMGKFGADGLAVYIYLLTAIYREGYCVRADEDFRLLVCADLRLRAGRLEEMFSFFLERGLFHAALYREQGVLTSAGIQRRFQEAVKARSSRRGIQVEARWWLLSDEETAAYIRREDAGTGGTGSPEQGAAKPEKGKAPLPVPDRAEMITHYGVQLVDTYLVKAAAYGRTGDQALRSAARWLAEDELSGKIKAPRPTSLDVDAYTDLVKGFRPRFVQKEETE